MCVRLFVSDGERDRERECVCVCLCARMCRVCSAVQYEQPWDERESESESVRVQKQSS